MCSECARQTLNTRHDIRVVKIGFRRGFTLIEVVAALAISGLIVVGARALLEGLGAQLMRLENLTRVADADANGERLLRGLLGQLEVPFGQAMTFGGDADSVHFSSWCRVPGGWEERCRVVLTFNASDDSVHLVARLSTRETLTLMGTGRSKGLLYLADAGEGGIWFEQWGDGRSVPVAIGVLLDNDTMIVRIGERN